MKTFSKVFVVIFMVLSFAAVWTILDATNEVTRLHIQIATLSNELAKAKTEATKPDGRPIEFGKLPVGGYTRKEPDECFAFVQRLAGNGNPFDCPILAVYDKVPIPPAFAKVDFTEDIKRIQAEIEARHSQKK